MGAKGRASEQNVEDIRKDANRNLSKISQVHNAPKIGRLVDANALIKTRITDYGAWDNRAKILQKSENGEMYEKYRNGYGNGFHTAEFALGQSLEALFYNVYQEGFDGTPIPPRLGEPYTCTNIRCRHHYSMPITALPLECTVCGRETPLGRLVYDGHYKR